MEKLVTKTDLIADFKKIGIGPGASLMLHSSCKKVGQIVGGPEMIIEGLLEVLGPKGTLMMYVSWDQSPYYILDWPQEKQELYRQHLPAFQPGKSRAMVSWSVLTEILRIHPQAQQSRHPEASVVAVGAQSQYLTEDHPYQYGYGKGSPFEKLCQLEGQVLMLGAPLESMTLIHYAEHIAECDHKKVARYQLPVLEEGKKVWLDIEDFDTNGTFPWEGEDYFKLILQDYLNQSGVEPSLIGQAPSYLFKAKETMAFAKNWLEDQFGQSTPQP